MAGIVAKKKKSSAVLKQYACTGVYLACTCTYIQVLLKVLVLYLSPSRRKGYVLVLCTSQNFKVLLLYLSILQSTWPHAWVCCNNNYDIAHYLTPRII